MPELGVKFPNETDAASKEQLVNRQALGLLYDTTRICLLGSGEGPAQPEAQTEELMGVGGWLPCAGGCRFDR